MISSSPLNVESSKPLLLVPEVYDSFRVKLPLGNPLLGELESAGRGGIISEDNVIVTVILSQQAVNRTQIPPTLLVVAAQYHHAEGKLGRSFTKLVLLLYVSAVTLEQEVFAR